MRVSSSRHIDFIILDLIIIELSFALAYAIRHTWDDFGRDPRYQMGALIVIAASAVWILLSRPYEDVLKRGYLKELNAVLRLMVLICATLMIYLFSIQRGQEFSRLVVLYFAIVGSACLYLERLLWKKIIHIRRGSVENIRRIFLISSSDRIENIIARIKAEESDTVTVAGIMLIDGGNDSEFNHEAISGYPVIKPEAVLEYIQFEWVDAVVFYEDKVDSKIEHIMDECAVMGITTHRLFDVERDRCTVKTVEKFGGVYTLTESLRVVDGYQLAAKRIVDIIGAVVGLCITAALIVIIGPLIFMSDPGAIFYSQERVGRNGRIFKIYKFRSMYKNADKRRSVLEERNEMKGPMFKLVNDPRVLGSGSNGDRHGIGWFIRKHSLDEFPQFLNVLKGDMSLVGTRPPTVDEWERYEARHRARLVIKPGLTGLWQVEGRSDIHDFDEVMALDMKYINEWTIAGDIRIMIRTVAEVFRGSGAR